MVRHAEIESVNLEYVKERVDNLPLLPSVCEELNRLSQDADDFYEKVGELAEQDPPLTARILKFANNRDSACDSHIFDVKDALPKLGVINTLELMKELTSLEAFEPTEIAHKGVWIHSIETAHICRFVAQHMKSFNVDPEMAYTCGLLHDVGRFVLLQVWVEAVENVDAHGWDNPEELTEVELEMFGFTHAEIGRIAAEHWKMPKTIINMLRFHHHYVLWDLDGVSEPFLQLLTIVQFSDFLSVLMIKNPEWPAWSDTMLRERVKEYCIYRDWPEFDFPIDEICAALPEIYEKCLRILQKSAVL